MEVAELKGELTAVKKAKSAEDSGKFHALKSKILDLQVEVQNVKDSLVLEKRRNAPRSIKQFVI